MRKSIVRLHGPIGKALDLSIKNRLNVLDYDLLVEPFKLRNELDNAWRCEFWGKIVRSSILSNYWHPDATLAQLIEKTVKDIMATQTPDGCISSYPEERQLKGWDIWGRKYVILGLLRYYDYVAPKAAVKECCCRVLDHFMSQVGVGKTDILDCGEHDGLAASSILGAVVGVYRISGEKRYREFAEYIIAQGCSKRGNVFEAALNGTLPENIGNGKAYELTSCFQGLAEYNKLHPTAKALEVCTKYFHLVRQNEIMVTGVSGLKDRWGEYWFSGTNKQTRDDVGYLGETCITTTWLHYCERIMELTGAPIVADEIERTTYNALLGAMSSDGSNWTHENPTPLTGGGYKQLSPDQILRCFNVPYGGNDCCRAQGPEGLALIPSFAIRKVDDEIVLNLFEELDAELDGVKVSVKGSWPYGDKTQISIESSGSIKLKLRIPSYLKSLHLNGESMSFVHQEYLTIEREWQSGDVLELEFDLTLREVKSADSYSAILRGAIVLAEDSRGAVPNANVVEKWNNRTLVDYVTAGNELKSENSLTVWLKS